MMKQCPAVGYGRVEDVMRGQSTTNGEGVNIVPVESLAYVEHPRSPTLYDESVPSV